MDETVPDPAARTHAGGLPLARWLAGAAVLCLLASGLLMWWQGGDAIFGAFLTAALALCF